MLNLKSLNPMSLLANPWGLAIITTALFLSGLTLGVKLMSGNLAKCREEVGQYKASYAQLEATAKKQNEAVTALETASKTAREKARQATIKAEARVRQQQGEVARLTALLERPDGKTCSQAIQEIKKGGK